MARPQKISPRQEYREQEHQRVRDASTLAETFHDLEALSAELANFDPEGTTRTRAVKYTFNLAHAKSLLRFDCPNDECVGGDFDLSAALASAIAARQATVTGEVVCQGWRNKNVIGQAHCHTILRYKLSLEYKAAGPRRRLM